MSGDTDSAFAREQVMEDFLDGVESRVTKQKNLPWVAYGPQWAMDKGAEDPPDDIEDPVWASSTGWMEKNEMEPQDGNPGLLLWYEPTDAEQ